MSNYFIWNVIIVSTQYMLWTNTLSLSQFLFLIVPHKQIFLFLFIFLIIVDSISITIMHSKKNSNGMYL